VKTWAPLLQTNPAAVRANARPQNAPESCQQGGKKRTIQSACFDRQPRRRPLFLQENTLSNHVYKHIELTGSSTKNIEDAVSTAVAKASLSLRNIHWFEVVETRGHVENGKVAHWQVTIKVGFTLED
jgi:flavin-binding protein dodecin